MAWTYPAKDTGRGVAGPLLSCRLRSGSPDEARRSPLGGAHRVRGYSPVATGREVWLYWLHDPEYSRPRPRPAYSIAMRLWHAVIPDPQ